MYKSTSLTDRVSRILQEAMGECNDSVVRSAMSKMLTGALELEGLKDVTVECPMDESSERFDSRCVSWIATHRDGKLTIRINRDSTVSIEMWSPKS